jgi:hypothetical protein
MRITILNWDVSIGFRARCAWDSFKLYHGESTHHLVWGKFSIYIENWTLEVHRVCAECDSTDVGEIHHGDEGWTVCQSCQSVESGYRYVNLREYENAA